MNEAPALTPGPALVFIALSAVVGYGSFRRAWIAPGAIVATAPFAWWHALGPTEITVSKAAFVGALAGTLVRWWMSPARAAGFTRFASNGALVSLAILTLWSCVSAFWAVSPGDAVRESLKWLWYTGVFAVTIASIEEPGDALRVLAALFAASAVTGIDGWWQSVTAAPAGFIAPNGAVVGRITGTLEGPNQFGGYLETVIPPLLACTLLIRLPWLVTVVGSLLFGLLASDLLLTYSRGALWACSAAVLVVIGAWVAATRRDAGQSPLMALLVAVCACVVIVPVASASISAIGWEHEFWTPAAGVSNDSQHRRSELWQCAVQIFERHPAGGTGAGNFADAKAQCGASLAGKEHFNANEWYLETAADLGIFGVVALAAFLLVLLSRARDARVWHSAVSVGAYAAVIAFVFHGFVDDVATYPKAALSFFVLAAILTRL